LAEEVLDMVLAAVLGLALV
jgi:hypothetical protein